MRQVAPSASLYPPIQLAALTESTVASKAALCLRQHRVGWRTVGAVTYHART